MQVLGTYEVDDRGRRCYLPPVPAFPKIDDVWPALERASKAVDAFDNALSAFPVPGVIGRLFARLDAVHSSGAEGATTTFTDLMEFESSLKRATDPEDARSVAGCAAAFDDFTE